MSVVEFTLIGEMKEQMRIVRFEVNSRPIGEKGTRCRYTTTKEITFSHCRLRVPDWLPIQMVARSSRFV